MAENLLLAQSDTAQMSVIGSMLIDDRCIPVVLGQLRAEDFTDGVCRNTFRAIKKLALAGKPVDPVTVVDAMQGGERYEQWIREVMEITPTAANVEAYADIVRRAAALYDLRAEADKLLMCGDLDEAVAVVRKMSGRLSATSRMPRMTAEELAKDFLARMRSTEKPEYLPWGLPTADRTVYAELGDMILLGGYPSAGKTLLSIQMALAQAKRYKVGYYTLETQERKMADRLFCHLSKVPFDAIKTRSFGDSAWSRFAEATTNFTAQCPVDFIRAAGSMVDDIAADAIASGYQIIYIDYLQLLGAPGVKPGNDYARVSAVSRSLKLFAQNHNVAVVALAQLSRPQVVGKDKKQVPPNMASFRESGQIEQDADAAFLLWANDPNNNLSHRTLKLGKNKEGRKFSVELDFMGATQTMVETEQPSASAAQRYIDAGRAIKRQNHANAQGQMSFRELSGEDKENPFG